MKTVLTALLCIVFFTGTAEARQRHKVIVASDQCNLPGPNSMPCEGVSPSPRGERIARSGFGTAQKVYREPAVGNFRYLSGSQVGRAPGKRVVRVAPAPRQRVSYGAPSPSIGGIVAPLAAKVSEIISTCGSQVVSAVRHTYVAGTRRISLHASGKAVDLSGNPSCIYAMLHDWRGGYSVDYARVRHVHLSYDPDGGREMGIRFVHGGHRTRHAHRRHHRYARAG